MKIHIEVVNEDGTVYQGSVLLTPAAKSRKSTTSEVDSRPKRKVRCPQAIRLLWQGGLFKSALSFAAIKAKLAFEGYNFPDNTLMMGLSNADYLTKRGSKGSSQWS